jgi:ribosome-binding protein aMBF1 (putative translation factor)
MNCHLCGKNCLSRLEGRRTVLGGKVLFLCNSCAPDGRPVREKPAVSDSNSAETATRAA